MGTAIDRFDPQGGEELVHLVFHRKSGVVPSDRISYCLAHKVSWICKNAPLPSEGLAGTLRSIRFVGFLGKLCRLPPAIRSLS